MVGVYYYHLLFFITQKCVVGVEIIKEKHLKVLANSTVSVIFMLVQGTQNTHIFFFCLKCIF